MINSSRPTSEPCDEAQVIRTHMRTHTIGPGIPGRLSEGRGNGVQMKMRTVWKQRWDEDYFCFK